MKKSSFIFSKDNILWARSCMRRYPQGKERSALIPILWRAQIQNGWLSKDAIDYVADLIKVPPIKVLEVASFYSMFNLKPVGKTLVQICQTTPCWLRGSDALVVLCLDAIGKEDTVKNHLCWKRVECLGACDRAPVVQINQKRHDKVTEEHMQMILKIKPS